MRDNLQARVYQSLEECWQNNHPDTYGRLFAHEDVGRYRISLAEYECPDVRQPRDSAHAYAWNSIELVLAGTGVEEYRSAQRHWAPGTVFSYAAYSEHFTVSQREAVRVCQVRVPPMLSPPDLSDPATSATATMLMHKIGQELQTDPVTDPFVLETLCEELFAPTPVEQDDSRRRPDWWSRLIEIVQANETSTVGLARIASEVSVHRSHLARSFREYTGLTLGEYVRRIRLGRAMQELLGDEKSLLEIALDAGFADQSHFTRTFRRFTGTTPLRFRRRATRIPRRR